MTVTRQLVNFFRIAFAFTVAGNRMDAPDARPNRVFDSGQLWPQAKFAILPSIAVVYPWELNWSVFASLAVYNYSTLLGGPLFEEPGWRGFALPCLEAQMSPAAVPSNP